MHDTHMITFYSYFNTYLVVFDIRKDERLAKNFKTKIIKNIQEKHPLVI